MFRSGDPSEKAFQRLLRIDSADKAVTCDVEKACADVDVVAGTGYSNKVLADAMKTILVNGHLIKDRDTLDVLYRSFHGMLLEMRGHPDGEETYARMINDANAYGALLIAIKEHEEKERARAHSAPQEEERESKEPSRAGSQGARARKRPAPRWNPETAPARVVMVYTSSMPRAQGPILDCFYGNEVRAEEISRDNPLVAFVSPGNVMNPDTTIHYAFAQDLVKFFNQRKVVGVPTELRSGAQRDAPLGAPNGPIDPINLARFSDEHAEEIEFAAKGQLIDVTVGACFYGDYDP